MFRRTIAAVVCFAAMLAYWLGYGAILNGSAFGVPFGWAFGSALTLSIATIPFTVDRDDPAGSGFALWGMLACLTGASAIFGAGIAWHSSREYWLGAAFGALIGWPLGYWAFGDDRKQRGVPRVSARDRANVAPSQASAALARQADSSSPVVRRP